MEPRERLIKSIEQMPRVRLTLLPTPLENLSSLSRMYHRSILIKRDDLTGVVFTGNKARKAEFLLGDAQRHGADIILTTGSPNSNHTRVISAGARKLGMDVILYIKGERPETYTGNLLLNRIFGARFRFVGLKPYSRILEIMERDARRLRRSGHKPYVIPVGGATPVGATGYTLAFLELMEQAENKGHRIDTIVHCSGTGGTYAGLLYGAKVTDAKTRIIAISDGTPKSELIEDTAKLIDGLAEVHGIRVKLNNDIHVYDDKKYIGKGYGIPSREGISAIKLLARSEGILLDPVYSSKAMAGMIDLIRRGVLKEDETIVFLHTGGTPAIFSYSDELSR